jgi:hypothetical protein
METEVFSAYAREPKGLISPQRFTLLLPVVLPSWLVQVDRRLDGAIYQSRDGLACIVSAAIEDDGKAWLHVSISYKDRLPSWEKLREIKDIFVGKDRTALQVLPKESKYVNMHPYCLHLWCCLDGDVVPDFTRGGKGI